MTVTDQTSQAVRHGTLVKVTTAANVSSAVGKFAVVDSIVGGNTVYFRLWEEVRTDDAVTSGRRWAGVVEPVALETAAGKPDPLTGLPPVDSKVIARVSGSDDRWIQGDVVRHDVRDRYMPLLVRGALLNGEGGLEDTTVWCQEWMVVGEAAEETPAAEAPVDARVQQLQEQVDRLTRRMNQADLRVAEAQTALQEFRQRVVDVAKEASDRHGWCEVVTNILRDELDLGDLMEPEPVDLEIQIRVSHVVTVHATTSARSEGEIDNDWLANSFSHVDTDSVSMDGDFEDETIYDVEFDDWEVVDWEVR